MRSITILSAALLFNGVAHAQVQDEIRRCAAIGADAERLACYDRLFRESAAPLSTPPAAPAAASATPPAPAGAAPAGSSADVSSAAAATTGATVAAAASSTGAAPPGDFGANPRLKEEQKRRERESQGTEETQELRARIRRVDEHPYGLHVLTLENGQVWQQKEKIWELELEAGDEIVIRRGMLGSYRLQLDGQGVSTTVTRVK